MGVINTQSLPNAEVLTNEQIEELLPHLDGIIGWAKQIQDYALKQALEGVKFKGYKVVAGKSNRKFTDEEAVADTLLGEGYDEDQVYVKKLETMTKLEALVGKKKFTSLLGNLIVKPLGKPTLVVETDSRPAYDAAAAAVEDFK